MKPVLRGAPTFFACRLGSHVRSYQVYVYQVPGTQRGVNTVAPVAYQVILEPGIGQFRGFETPRVRTRINSWGLFSCAQIDFRKAREREVATLDEKSTSSGISEPYAR